MNFEIKKEKLSVPHCESRVKAEQSVDCVITLPDYCTDIKRILKCTLIPGVHSVSRAGERVSASGNVLVRVLYEGEKEKIDCYEKSVELSVNSHMKDITDNMIITARAVSGYVNCRASSQRKISVSGNVSVEFSALCGKITHIPTDITGGEVQCKKESFRAEQLLCIGEKTLDMNETVTVDKSLPPIGKILRQEAFVTLDSKKAVSGKLLIKGQLTCRIVYCPSEGEGKLQHLVHTMPLSQIIDIEDIDEDMEISVSCNVNQLVVSVKNDGDDGRAVEFDARISAVVEGCRIKEYEFITDCYCTHGEIEAEYMLTDIVSPINNVTKTENIKEALELGSTAREICDIWAGRVKSDMKAEGDKAKGVCRITLCVLYLDEKGSPCYTEKDVEHFCELPVSQNAEAVRCDFDAVIKRVDFSSLHMGKTDVSIEADLYIKLSEVKSPGLLMNVKYNQNQQADSRAPGLTLYYCERGERVWDIAKKYRTTVEAVKQENEINTDEMTEERILLIPCV